MKHIDDVETDKFSLCVYECDCGFHIGLDFSYIDQVNDIKIKCPSCKKIIDTKKIREI